MWGFGSASCYEATARTYFVAHLEQMRAQYRELPIPRYLPPFLPTNFVQFMRDHQQQVEAQQEREVDEPVRDMADIVGNEDLSWLWSYGSSFIANEMSTQADLIAAATALPPSSDERYTLKRVLLDDQLDQPSKPSCTDWLVKQSNVISQRILESHREWSPRQQLLDSTELEVDPIGFDQMLPPKLHVDACGVEQKHFKWKTLELPRLDTGYTRCSMILQQLDEKRREYLTTYIDENAEMNTIAASSSAVSFLREWPTNSIDLSLRSELDQICSSYQVKDEKKKCVDMRFKSSNQPTRLPQKFRLDSDNLYIGVPDIALKKQSVEILKKMIRCNAQVTLLLQSNSSLDIFDAMKKEIYVWNTMHGVLAGDASKLFSKGGQDLTLRQILLPSHIPREDDLKLNSACEALVEEAHHYFKGMLHQSKLPTDSTITTLDMSSLWNQKSMMNAGANLIQENPVWEKCSDLKSSRPDSLDQSRLKSTATISTCRKYQSDDQKMSLNRKETPSKMVETKTIIGKEINSLEPTAKFADDIPISTDDLVNSFFCVDENNELAPAKSDHESLRYCEEVKNSDQDQVQTDNKLIYQLTRPVLWDLARKKVMRVDAMNIQVALNQISLEVLETIIFKLHSKVKQFSLNPSIASHEEIVDACSSFRQVVWLHSLRMIQLCPQSSPGKVAPQELVKRMKASLTYRKAIGPSHGKDLYRLYEDEISSSVNSNTTSEIEKQRTDVLLQNENEIEPPAKKRRILKLDEDQEKMPVRVLCSVGFLSKEGLLDELCSDQGISIIERDLPEPIDLIIDERNGACAIDASLFEDESQMKSLTFKLAAVQIQFQKIWIVIFADDPDVFKRVEPNLHAFYTALVNFRIEVQPLTSSTDEETSSLIRLIIDQCAKTALEEHRTLPQMWYQRPYVLDEESQHERFLASTQILNHFSAQSVLHKISTDDLFMNSFTDLKAMVQDSMSEHQLTLLWGYSCYFSTIDCIEETSSRTKYLCGEYCSMLHQPHGIQQLG